MSTCYSFRMVWRGTIVGILLVSALSVVGRGEDAPSPGPGRRSLGFGVPAADVRITLPPGWRELRFRSVSRPTVYRVLDRGTEGELLAMSRGGASLLYTRVSKPPDSAELCWEWRVDRLPGGADMRVSAKEDAGARIYVGFRYDPGLVPRGQRFRYSLARARYGQYPPYSGLVYVWSVEPAAGTAFVHTDWPRLGVVVLRDRSDQTGTWHRECREPARDYRSVFHAEPPPISHVGTMTDSDDTGTSAVARYRRISLHSVLQ